jgi:Fe2+ or Zn2+ uptake regulation protein
MDIPKYLVEHGVKPSFQRIKILEYLIQEKNHPTVNDIYLSLLDTIPTLSKTTVYNTLNLMIEYGLVHEVLVEENEVRYEFAEHFHGHFKCEQCGRLYDIPLSIEIENITDLQRFQIKEQHIFFKGICSQCKNSTGKH